LTRPATPPYVRCVSDPSAVRGGASPAPSDAPLPARVWLAIAGLVFLCHVVPLLRLVDDQPRGFLWGDANYYALAAQSLAERGSLDLVAPLTEEQIRAALKEDQLARDDSGRLVLKHGSILPFLGAPFFALLGIRGLLLFNVLLTSGIVVALVPLLRPFVGIAAALATAYLLGTATLVSPYAYNFSADVAGTLAVVLALVAVLRRALFAAGLLLGLAVSLKLSLLPAVATLAAGTLALALADGGGSAPRRALAGVRLAFGGLCGVAPMLALNATLFGSIWVTGYQRIAAPDGGTMSHASDFNQPLVAGFVRALFDGTYGLVPTNPVLLLALFGAPLWLRLPSRRQRGEIALLLAAALAQLVVIARYDQWNYSHVSNRFLMVLVPLLAPLVALAVERLGRLAARG